MNANGVTLQTGGGGFSAANLSRQVYSEHGCSPELVALLAAYAAEMEMELITLLGDYYVEAGIGGISLDTYIDRTFVQIWTNAKQRVEEGDLPKLQS